MITFKDYEYEFIQSSTKTLGIMMILDWMIVKYEWMIIVTFGDGIWNESHQKISTRYWVTFVFNEEPPFHAVS